jgi:CheY-like chemotaxis protein
MIATELRAVGYHVVEARTGAELLNEIAAALLSNDRAAQPDVIVCDIVLPGVTGLEILAGLRDAKWGTVIILMTGHSDRGWREEATALGADAFFQKPFEVDDLVTAVLNIVPASRRPGAHRKPRDAAS